MRWFPIGLLLRTVPARVRTDGDFAAADPWNGGRQAQFTVEIYKMVPELWGVSVARDARLLGDDLFGIRSGIDGRSHRLPGALVELWRTRRIATEELPRLLYEVQPSLRRSSYLPILHHRRFEVCGAIIGLLCLAIMIACLVAIPEDGTGARALGTFGFGLLAAVLPLLFVFAARRRRRLCRREMERIMACRVRQAL
jgi:hypothetical protein